MDSQNSNSLPDGVHLGEDAQPKTLYVGNLDAQMTEEFLVVLFSQIGLVKGCKMIQEPNGDPYAFIEFWEHHAAAAARASMNKRSCFGKEMKVNWATSSPNGQSKPGDTSNHYSVFVGDLSSEIEVQALREAFTPFGEVADCRIVRDPQTLKSKGYAFVSYVKKSDAETAIAAMNGQWLGNRSIRTNWATRKPPPQKEGGEGGAKQLQFEEVFNKSSETNCTIYVGGLTNGLTDDLIHQTFAHFGHIQEVRVFKDKGYAFIRFATKESAAHAIVTVHNTEINGQTVKCSWGKETGDPSSKGQQGQGQGQMGGGGGSGGGGANQYGYTSLGQVGAAGVGAAAAQYPQMNYAQQMGYWNAQGYNQAAVTAAATAQAQAAQAQLQNQFLQGMQQGFPGYANFGYQQGYMGNVGGMPASTWDQAINGGGGAAASQQMGGPGTASAAAASKDAALAVAAAAYYKQQFQM